MNDIKKFSDFVINEASDDDGKDLYQGDDIRKAEKSN